MRAAAPLLLLAAFSTSALADQRVTLVYRVEPASRLGEAAATVGKRLQRWGMGSVSRREGSLVVELPDVRDEAELRVIAELLTTRGRLEVAPAADWPRPLAPDPTGEVTLKDGAPVAADRREPGGGAGVPGTEVLGAYLKAQGVAGKDVAYQRVVGRAPGWRAIAIDGARRTALAMTGGKVAAPADDPGGEPEVKVTLDGASAKKVAALARAGKKLVFLVDGEVTAIPAAPLAGAALAPGLPRIEDADKGAWMAQADLVILATPMSATLTETSRNAEAIPRCAGCATEEEACKLAHFEACERACRAAPPRCGAIAGFLVDGPARMQNHLLAANISELACEAGDKPACLTGGRLFLEREGVPVAMDKGRRLLGRACAAKIKAGCDEVEKMAATARRRCDDAGDPMSAEFCARLMRLDPDQAAHAREQLQARKRPL